MYFCLLIRRCSVTFVQLYELVMAVTEQLAEQRRRTEADQHTRESQRRERTHRSSHTHAMVGGSRLVCISTTRRVVDPRRTHRTPSSIT